MTLTPKRITSAAAYAQVEYSTLCPWSVGNKWLLLQDGRGFYAVHTGEGDFDRLTHLGHNSEARWSSTEPNIFYYLIGNALRRYDAMTHESSMVQIFTEYVLFAEGERNGVQGMGEGDIEGSMLALAGMRADGKRDVFLYDVEQKRKGKALTLEPAQAHGFDQLYVVDGKVVIGWYASADPNIPIEVQQFKGLELYDSDMNFIRRLATVIGHMDGATW